MPVVIGPPNSVMTVRLAYPPSRLLRLETHADSVVELAHVPYICSDSSVPLRADDAPSSPTWSSYPVPAMMTRPRGTLENLDNHEEAIEKIGRASCRER